MVSSASTAALSPAGEAYAASSTPPPFGITALGGLKGTSYTAHASGDQYDYAEDVALDFPQSVTIATFNAHYAIKPAAPSSTYQTNVGKRVAITVRKVPGQTYTITIEPGVASATSSAQLTKAYTFTIKTNANVTVPVPARSTKGEPYRYGVLEHPFSFSLTGSTAAQQIATIAAAGARFARIDYSGAQIEPQSGVYDFSTEDQIMDRLAAGGITELPIVDQYSVATWATLGQPYPAIWSTPAQYASFAGAIAAHVALKYPQITHLELFNEPNLGGWWDDPNPDYAATNGTATAAYMLAAYAAIKAVNPKFVVVGPALSDGGSDVDARTFLTTMYGAGCKTGKCWDVLSVHNYAWIDPTYAISTSTQARWAIYQDLQAIATAHGDATPHVMITEWAFSTDVSAQGFDPHVQARFIAEGFNLMLADPTVDGIVYTNIYTGDSGDFWGLTALTNPDFTRLPAFTTYQAFTGD